MSVSESASLYLNLLKRCLTDSIYDGGLNLISGKFKIDENTLKFHSVEAPVADPSGSDLLGKVVRTP